MCDSWFESDRPINLPRGGKLEWRDDDDDGDLDSSAHFLPGVFEHLRVGVT